MTLATLAEQLLGASSNSGEARHQQRQGPPEQQAEDIDRDVRCSPSESQGLIDGITRRRAPVNRRFRKRSHGGIPAGSVAINIRPAALRIEGEVAARA
jgi:hypothetical protein